MITIYAEKPDMGTKIAAALDCITLHTGRKVSFDDLEQFESLIKKQRAQDGYFLIKYQGQDCFVTWGYGHMASLKQASDYDPSYSNWRKMPLPFIPDDYELKPDGRKEQLKIIRDCFRKSDMIICATDDDREGDLIFDYLYRSLKCKKPFMRALFNKQSKDEFVKAFRLPNLVPGKDRMNTIEAGRARSAGDFVVGANLTAAFTLQSNGKTVLSIGRVQTATLNMIVERELAIRSFTPEKYNACIGTFTKDDGSSYKGRHHVKMLSDDDAAKLMDKFSKGSGKAKISDVARKDVTRIRPNLYSLQTLQMAANKKYGYSLGETLQTAQELYEKGYTTYPRTDSVFLTNDMGPEMIKVLSNILAMSEYEDLDNGRTLNTSDKHYFDSSKVDSHYAIVPTTKIPSFPSLSDMEKNVYDLIARSVICMLYDNAVISETAVKTSCEGEEFSTKGSSIKHEGFYKVTGAPSESFIPPLAAGDIVSAVITMEEKYTEPPKRYTDASLLNAMINCGREIEDEELRKLMMKDASGKPRGLGRPSTQANIMQVLILRKYVTRIKKNIYATELGIKVIQDFPVQDIKSPVMTAAWELRLDNIEKGTDSYGVFMKDLEDKVREWTAIVTQGVKFDMSETDYKCPVCGKPLRELDWGYGCSGYKDKSCSLVIPKEMGSRSNPKTLSRKNIEDLVKKGETGLISEFTSNDGKEFSASLYVDKETQKVRMKFPERKAETTDFKCPKCKSPVTELTNVYACSAGKEKCSFFLSKSLKGKVLTKTQIKKLLSGDEAFVTGLKSDKGFFYDAFIRLENGSIRFRFEDKDKKKK